MRSALLEDFAVALDVDLLVAGRGDTDALDVVDVASVGGVALIDGVDAGADFEQYADLRQEGVAVGVLRGVVFEGCF